ncbi:hypothetical protein BD408DRAFT_431542 [Parasitella parasitica]|nr:hypothetical protein BD408DRAFT_431542 [Parasitella parasitica]
MERPYEKFTLPLEIWCMVFHQVNSVKWIGNCRLVCRDWNPYAEEVMFGQNLELTTVEKTIKFIYHLEKNPKMAEFIKDIYVCDFLSLPLETKLLDIALTSKIRYLKGEMNEELFGHLLEIAQNSPSKLSGLKSLPNFSRRRPIGASTTRPNYYKTLLFFKESLTHLSVVKYPFEIPEQTLCVIPRLNEFENLTELSLDLCGMPHLREVSMEYIEIDNILSKCTKNLTSLTLIVDYRSTTMGKKEFKDFLKLHNVQQVRNVHTLKLGTVYSPLIIEYLLYKYPSVSNMTVGYIKDFSDRIMEEVKNIDMFQVIGYMPNVESLNSNTDLYQGLMNLLRRMKSATNQLRILQRLENTSGNGLLEITKFKSTGTTHFNILVNGYAQAIHKEIMLSVSPVSHLGINYIDYPTEFIDEIDDEDFEQPTSRRFDETGHPLMGRLDNTEQPTASEEFCELMQIIPFDQLNKLTSLELFSDEKTNEDICEEIAYNPVPDLKSLTLGTCFCYDEEHIISLPEVDLEAVSLVRRFCSTDKCSQVQKVLLVTQKTNAPHGNYYFLTPGAPSRCEQISQRDVPDDLRNIPVIRLTFKSLNCLKINLGALVINVKFDKEFQIDRN